MRRPMATRGATGAGRLPMVLALLALLLVAGADASGQGVAVRHWHFQAQDWELYTANPEERPGGWLEGGILCRVYPPGTPATVPLYRVWRLDGGHLYTTDERELEQAKSWGWRLEGVLGNVAREPQRGTVPLFRFVKPNGRVLLSLRRDEAARAGVRFRDTVGYVLPPPLPRIQTR